MHIWTPILDLVGRYTRGQDTGRSWEEVMGGRCHHICIYPWVLKTGGDNWRHPTLTSAPHKGQRLSQAPALLACLNTVIAAYTSLPKHHPEVLLLLSILLYRGAGITDGLQHLPFPGLDRSELRSSHLPPNGRSLQSTSCSEGQHYPALPEILPWQGQDPGILPQTSRKVPSHLS